MSGTMAVTSLGASRGGSRGRSVVAATERGIQVRLRRSVPLLAPPPAPARGQARKAQGLGQALCRRRGWGWQRRWGSSWAQCRRGRGEGRGSSAGQEQGSEVALRAGAAKGGNPRREMERQSKATVVGTSWPYRRAWRGTVRQSPRPGAAAGRPSQACHQRGCLVPGKRFLSEVDAAWRPASIITVPRSPASRAMASPSAKATPGPATAQEPKSEEAAKGSKDILGWGLRERGPGHGALLPGPNGRRPKLAASKAGHDRRRCRQGACRARGPERVQVQGARPRQGLHTHLQLRTPRLLRCSRSTRAGGPQTPPWLMSPGRVRIALSSPLEGIAEATENDTGSALLPPPLPWPWGLHGARGRQAQSPWAGDEDGDAPAGISAAWAFHEGCIHPSPARTPA